MTLQRAERLLWAVVGYLCVAFVLAGDSDSLPGALLGAVVLCAGVYLVVGRG